MKSYVVEGVIEAVGNSQVSKNGTNYNNVKIGNKIIDNFSVMGSSSLFFHVGRSGKFFIVENSGNKNLLYGVVRDGEVLADDSQKIKSELGKVSWINVVGFTGIAILPITLVMFIGNPLLTTAAIAIWAFIAYSIKKKASKVDKAMDELPVAV